MTYLRWLCFCAACTAFSGCYVFSNHQSARLIAPDEIEITPILQQVNFTEDGTSEQVGIQFGFQFTQGLTRHLNLRARYERIDPDGPAAYHYFDFGPKFGKVDGRLALELPFGAFFGEDVSEDRSLQFHPALMYTHSFTERIELTGFAKYLFFLFDDSDDLAAFGLGAGFTSEDGRVCVRPEFAVLRNPGEDGYYSSFGLGLSFRVKNWWR